MAWEYEDLYGAFHSVDTETLRRHAFEGLINRQTEVVSTATGKRGLAGTVKGLSWNDDPPVQEPPKADSVSWEAFRDLQQQTHDALNEWRNDQVELKRLEYQPRSVPVQKSNPGFFDINFREAITPVLVSALWQLWLWLSILAMVSMIGLWSHRVAISDDDIILKGVKILFSTIAAVFVWLFFSILNRIVLEAAVVLFRIADYLKQISEK